MKKSPLVFYKPNYKLSLFTKIIDTDPVVSKVLTAACMTAIVAQPAKFLLLTTEIRCLNPTSSSVFYLAVNFKENLEMKKGPQQINAETIADAFLVEK